MMYDKTGLRVYAGTTAFELLSVAMIVLKVAGVIDWPWIWVLAPLWGSAILALIIMFAVAVFLMLKK